MSASTRPRPSNGFLANNRPDSFIRRSWHAMTDRLSPFSPSALASLPAANRPKRYARADNIPETENGSDGQRRDYHAINSLPPAVRVPKKITTPLKVESKVWFANERTWVSWMNLAVLIGTLALALFNSSQDTIARRFAYAYAVISVGVLVYGYLLYQRRITMIRRRDPGSFDDLAGPLVISAVLFFAILANFIIRVRELQEKNVPIPGSDLVTSIMRPWYGQDLSDPNQSGYSFIPQL